MVDSTAYIICHYTLLYYCHSDICVIKCVSCKNKLVKQHFEKEKDVYNLIIQVLTSTAS